MLIKGHTRTHAITWLVYNYIVTRAVLLGLSSLERNGLIFVLAGIHGLLHPFKSKKVFMADKPIASHKIILAVMILIALQTTAFDQIILATNIQTSVMQGFWWHSNKSTKYEQWLVQTRTKAIYIQK